MEKEPEHPDAREGRQPVGGLPEQEPQRREKMASARIIWRNWVLIGTGYLMARIHCGRSVPLVAGMISLLTAVLSAFSLQSMPSAATTVNHRAVALVSTATCSGTLPAGTVVGVASTSDDDGYWVVNDQGLVVACGDAQNFGGLTSPPNEPIVGIAATPDGGGYYLVAADGGIFTYGDASFQGSAGALVLNEPVVGMAVDPRTGGYWLVASDGGIFSFNARFYGSTGAMVLNKPIVGLAVDPRTGGYWLVASDGGIFSFNAPFYGSTGAIALNKPVVGMSPDASGGGYWLVAADGGIFSFGDISFYGSAGSAPLNRPIVGMESNATATGYRFVASDGGIFDFGASEFFGSAVTSVPVAPPPTTTSPSSGAASCTLSLSSTSPADNAEITASITSSVPNTPFTLAKAYKTTTTYDYGTTNASGDASIEFDVSGATVGYPVVVTLTVGGATCITSFTPH
jgi:hypothetical protein